MKNLEKILSAMGKKGVRTDCNCTFAKLTTFGSGGKIALTLYPDSVKKLIFAEKYLRRHKIPRYYLGHGSNVLASDNDYDGVVVVTSQAKKICVEKRFVTADCGVSTSSLCALLVKNGLTGGEFFGCLPATVGGAVVCNAGCFGQCAEQVVQSVVALRRGKLVRLSQKQCGFQKRQSVFKRNDDFVVLQVVMKFSSARPSEVQAAVAQMRKKKSETQPLSVRSAGCVLFSEKTAVSRLIDLAGLKGFKIGGAQVSEKHAGFVINLDKATSKDIYLLIQHVKNVVTQKFGILPQTELCFVNFDGE